jgi:hypothetical protein
MAVAGNDATTAYRILISRSQQRPFADFYGFSIREVIPSFPLPLKKSDRELTVQLQETFNGVYDRARYQARIDYRQPLPPSALSKADQQWLDDLLAPVRGG